MARITMRKVQETKLSEVFSFYLVAGINDLASKRPDLAIDWHPTLNGDLLPTQVALNYSKTVWWKCLPDRQLIPVWSYQKRSVSHSAMQ